MSLALFQRVVLYDFKALRFILNNIINIIIFFTYFFNKLFKLDIYRNSRLSPTEPFLRKKLLNKHSESCLHISDNNIKWIKKVNCSESGEYLRSLGCLSFSPSEARFWRNLFCRNSRETITWPELTSSIFPRSPRDARHMWRRREFTQPKMLGLYFLNYFKIWLFLGIWFIWKIKHLKFLSAQRFFSYRGWL